MSDALYARAKAKAAMAGRTTPDITDCYGFDKKLHGIVVQGDNTVTLHDDDAGQIYIEWTRPTHPKVSVRCGSVALAFGRAQDAGVPPDLLQQLGNQQQVMDLE